jgi:hypothetical protein
MHFRSFVAGLVPAIHDLREPIVEIVPIGILMEDQPHFPRAPPMFHISLSLPRRAHVIVMLSQYEPPQAVLFGEALDKTRAVFPRTSGKVIRCADVQDAIGPVRHDVYPSRHYGSLLEDTSTILLVDGRHEAGHER